MIRIWPDYLELTKARLGALAVCLPLASAVAGEPIIMGTQRVSPDPQETARIEQRKGSAFNRERGSSPFTDDFSTRTMLLPVPVESSRSKRDQNARDEKMNWMMLNRGDLTDMGNPDELLGVSSTSLEKEPGRRDFFFTKPDDREPVPDRRLANQTAPSYAEDRSGLPSQGSVMPGYSGKRLDDGRERDDSSPSVDGLLGVDREASRQEDELGLGPLLDPARVTGSQALERWSASLKEVSQPRSQASIPEAQDRREHYLNFLGSSQYGGVSYPVTTELGKYKREWMGSAAANRQPSGSGALAGGISGSPLAEAPLSMAPSGSASSLSQNRLNTPRGNLSGAGNLPSYLQEQRSPSLSPRPDYSLPKAPGRGFDF